MWSFSEMPPPISPSQLARAAFEQGFPAFSCKCSSRSGPYSTALAMRAGLPFRVPSRTCFLYVLHEAPAVLHGWAAQMNSSIANTTFRFDLPEQGLLGLSFCVASTAASTCRKPKGESFLRGICTCFQKNCWIKPLMLSVLLELPEAALSLLIIH